MLCMGTKPLPCPAPSLPRRSVGAVHGGDALRRPQLHAGAVQSGVPRRAARAARALPQKLPLHAGGLLGPGRHQKVMPQWALDGNRQDAHFGRCKDVAQGCIASVDPDPGCSLSTRSVCTWCELSEEKSCTSLPEGRVAVAIDNSRCLHSTAP